MRKCNGCYKFFPSSGTIGGQHFCACGSCIRKVSIKFFNGDVAATIKFINAENWRRVSRVKKAIEEEYEKEEEEGEE